MNACLRRKRYERGYQSSETNWCVTYKNVFNVNSNCHNRISFTSFRKKVIESYFMCITILIVKLTIKEKNKRLGFNMN